MAQTWKLGTTATSVRTDANGVTHVCYHSTDVVSFDSKQIMLRTGGWRTATTKARMNQAAVQFSLGYSVSQVKGEWFISRRLSGGSMSADAIFIGEEMTFPRF